MDVDLGARLDEAVSGALAAAQRITGVDLPSLVTFVYRVPGGHPRRVDRAEALALVAASGTEELLSLTKVFVAGTHDGRTIIELRESPMAASPANPFRAGGVTAASTRDELELHGRTTIEACGIV